MSARSDRLRLEVQRASKPFALLVVLLVGGLAATLAMFSHLSFQRPWDNYREVKFAFTDVKGTVPGHQPVRISGVTVGVVRHWKVAGDKAVLTLAIKTEHGRIYRDARARLRPVTPLQDMYVDLDRGTPAAGEIPSNTVVSANQTVTPVDISRVLNVFDADTRVELSNLIRGFGKGLDDNGAQLKAAFVQLTPFLTAARELSSAMATRRRELARLVHNLGGVTKALGARDRQLASLVTNGNATLGELASHDAPLTGTIQQLPELVDAMRTSLATLSRAEGDLDPALRGLRPVAKQLKPGLDGLRTFSQDATPALRALVPSVSDLRPLVASLDPTAASAQTAVERLRPQIPQFDRMTQLVEVCEDTISKFFQWTPSVLKYGDANGANPRAEVSIGTDSAVGGPVDPSLKKPAKCFDNFKQEDAG